MSKQEKLISADKLLKWMEESPESEGFWDLGNVHRPQLAFDNLTDAINKGSLDPDPAPTIKPGDKVKYNGWQFKHIDTAMVNHLRLERFGTYASISHDGEYYIVPIDHLEVVKDE